MTVTKIREPRQQRSIEKKNKIIEVGFGLMCIPTAPFVNLLGRQTRWLGLRTVNTAARTSRISREAYNRFGKQTDCEVAYG